MNSPQYFLRRLIALLWQANAPLTIAMLVFAVAGVGTGVGLLLDPREVTGAPVWLKPMKFALSSLFYTGTIAWMLGHVRIWPRAVRLASTTLAVSLVGEVGIIFVQAARGQASHFHRSTPVDSMLLTALATGILVIWFSSLLLVMALFRQRFTVPAWGWALRLGLLLTVGGSALASLMLRPTPEQMRLVRKTGQMPYVGAHTVGSPDGGPGLPVTRWNHTHGDQRVSHFVSLHAAQVLPLLAWWIVRRRQWSGRQHTRLVCLSAASYAGLMALLLWQALRGQPLTAPDKAMLTMLGAWSAATGLGIALVLHQPMGLPSQKREALL